MIMISIYVLKLEKDKYYIGKTTLDVQDRFQQHLDGNGSLWTKIYKPIKIIRVIKNSSHFDEDKILKEYMAQYGIDKCRGSNC